MMIRQIHRTVQAPRGCRSCPRQEAGFNLVEMIVVIAVTGILSAIVAVFIQGPVSGYIDTTRRAVLTDVADTALRRISRDLHLALPNSLRVDATSSFLEFLQTSDGGRYRVDGPGDILDFTDGADNTFDVLGPTAITLAPGNQIVIFNLGIPGADAYAAGANNRRAYAGAAGAFNNVNFTATGTPFPFDSPGHRFFVVTGAVSYECNGTQLVRHWGYGIQVNQPVAFPGTPAALLAGSANTTVACRFTYVPGAVTDRSGMVEITLNVTDIASGEQVSLYHEVHVNNVP